VIYTLNRTDSLKVVAFDYSLLKNDFSSVSLSMFDADDVFSRNKIDLPNEIRRKDWTEKCYSEELIIHCPPRSFIQAILLKN